MSGDTGLGRLRVVHMTSVHSPDDIRIVRHELMTLSEHGVDVVLIAPRHARPAPEGVRVLHVPAPASRWQRITRTTRDVYRSAVSANADIYHFHDPELIPVGILLKVRGKRVVYDVHEDYPRQILTKDWIPSVFRGVIAQGTALAEKIASLLFSGIVTATPAIARRFPAHKTVVVQNFPALEEFSVGEVVPYHERPLRAAYLGGISAARGVFEMVRSMELIPNSFDAKLVLAGTFDSTSLEEEVRGLPGWSRVDFLGWQSRQQVADILASVRAGLVLFHPVPNHTEAEPNKLFEYMCAGLPIVASDFPLWQEIVGKTECGLLVDPLDPSAIADAIRWIFEHPEEAAAMGERAQEAARTRYNWDAEARKLLEFYGKLA